MHTDILKRVDTLVNMAGSSSDSETLQAELEEVEKEIEELNEELSTLKDGSQNDKYFKASEKQVDENIKVSLEAKIKKKESSVKELQKQIDSVSFNENNLHSNILKLKEEVEKSNEYILVLNERINTVKGDLLKKYKEILNEEKNRNNDLVLELKEKENNYDNILENLNYLHLAIEEEKAKLLSDNERLDDTKASLVNPNSYVDEELKKIDEKRMTEIMELISELDKRKLEIITDPVMIAEDAKELISKDDQVNAITKLKELVTIVKAKPFMDISNKKDLGAFLDEELEAASNKRDEFASIIDSKDYLIRDSEVVIDRIDYLKKQIEKYEEKIASLKAEINYLDSDNFIFITEKLNNAIKIAEELEKSIENYELIINNNEEKTPKRRAVLNAAFQKKQKDLEEIQKIIENYRIDQKNMIQKAHEIEALEISEYEILISDIKEEIDNLENSMNVTNYTKDILEIENDKVKLKELDAEVKAIKHRKKYGETPNEIFDEIEIYLGSLDVAKDEEKNINGDLNNIDVKELDLNDSNNLEDNENIIEPLDSITVMNELPKLDSENIESERIKVIDIEPLSDEQEIKIENPFVIGDYTKDDFNNEE